MPFFGGLSGTVGQLKNYQNQFGKYCQNAVERGCNLLKGGVIYQISGIFHGKSNDDIQIPQRQQSIYSLTSSMISRIFFLYQEQFVYIIQLSDWMKSIISLTLIS